MESPASAALRRGRARGQHRGDTEPSVPSPRVRARRDGSRPPSHQVVRQRKSSVCCLGLLGKGDGFTRSTHHLKMQEKLQRPNPLQLQLLLPDHRPRVKPPPCVRPPLSASDRKSVSTGNSIQTGSRDSFHGFSGGRGLSHLKTPHKGLGAAPAGFGRTSMASNPPPHAADSTPSLLGSSSCCVCSSLSV